ncbi:phosphorus acquisition-controlling protein [Stagonosporopsis vannaccii]|nr:phosphorus acquisition-controlling protein [Stagonosporopsis vannaccii]
MPSSVAMQPPQPQQSVETDTHSHRGPLSRTWPQLFKKRRRYSPVRESVQSQAQPIPQPLQSQSPSQYNHIQSQQQQQAELQPQFQASVSIRPVKQPSISTASIRSPSITADTASTISTISEISSLPPQQAKRVPIARRTSSIATTDSNAAGGVTTPQADLLASKSNYELISSGQHLEMGLHFSTAMATGVMMKRATHRAAEQARRDRMKTAMVDLAEFLLDGEVTFGSGTTCFVVMRGDPKEVDGQSVFSETSGMSGMSEGSGKGKPGEKKTVNKARLIEMALEKMKAQEKEIELLRKEVEDLRCGDKADQMDES